MKIEWVEQEPGSFYGFINNRLAYWLLFDDDRGHYSLEFKLKEVDENDTFYSNEIISTGSEPSLLKRKAAEHLQKFKEELTGESNAG